MDMNTRYAFRSNSITTRRRRQKLCECNSQICFSYFLGVMASLLVVAGVYLSYHQWDHSFLILSIMGFIFIFVGSCFYYNGHRILRKSAEKYLTVSNRTRKRTRHRNSGPSSDQLMPSSAHQLSQSQFSLNMIPQYFSANNSEATAATNVINSSPPVTHVKTFSQIFSVNGQSYLILPLTGEALPADESFPLQNIVVKVSADEKTKNAKSDAMNVSDKEDMAKRIKKGEQSCQTDEIPLSEWKRINNLRRDVQLQTHHNREYENTSTDTFVIHEVSSHRNAIAGPSHASDGNPQPESLSENGYLSNITEIDSLNISADSTHASLIDFDEQNNNAVNVNCGDNNNNADQRENEELLNSLIHETLIRADEFIANDFYNLAVESVAEMDNEVRISTPPPSYDEVIDQNSDDNERSVIVDYGTL